jgi:hypothetical protein
MNQGLSIANSSLSSSSINKWQVDEGDAISDSTNNINSNDGAMAMSISGSSFDGYAALAHLGEEDWEDLQQSTAICRTEKVFSFIHGC